MKIAVSFSTMIFFCISVFGQAGMKEQVIQEMKKISDRYKNSPFVAFDVEYKYSSQSDPGHTVDSLSGAFKMHGNHYWYRLDNTESAGSSDLSVMLFREDKIMYLAKPKMEAASISPIAVMDSLLSDTGKVECQLVRTNRRTKIILSFRPGSKYKKIEYDIDAKTGLLTAMTSIVQADEMYDPVVKDKVTKGAYAIIVATFSHYREGSFDTKDFDLSRYFIKQGGEYIPAAAYQDFKIFLGSPNL